MSAIVEKLDGTLVVSVRLTLKPGRDDLQIALVRSAPRRQLARCVREAMRFGASAGAPVEEDELDLGGLGMEL